MTRIWQYEALKVSLRVLALSSIVLVPLTDHSLAHEVQPQISTLAVNGTGTVDVAPDIAIISFGVLREAQTAREALSANNQAMADVLKAMKEMDIADRDLQTSGFNISPRYHYPNRRSDGEQKPPVIVGYQVSNQITVRIRNLENVGVVLDKVVTLGVNSGGNIQFSNDDPAKILETARKRAMEDAIAKANTLTGTAGVKLKRILSINEHSSQPRPMPMAKGRMMAEAMAADSVPIQGGENTYQVDVSVSWELE